MRNLEKTKCLVLLSGGQDSATCLAWTLDRFTEIYAISFYYGQKHMIEIEYSKKLAKLAKVKEHIIIDVKELFDQVTKSALTDFSQNISGESEWDKNLPASFVPFRNLQFITQAASVAYMKGIKNLITGVCQTDFSGYPDCRDIFIKSLNVTLNLAGDCDLEIHTPLMWLTKSETVKMMKNLDYLDWYKYTNTCYNGNNCGTCPACKLRIKGFKEAGIEDPIDKNSGG